MVCQPDCATIGWRKLTNSAPQTSCWIKWKEREARRRKEIRGGRGGRGRERRETKMANSRKYKSWLFDLRRYCVTLSVQKRITSQKSYVHYLYFFTSARVVTRAWGRLLKSMAFFLGMPQSCFNMFITAIKIHKIMIKIGDRTSKDQAPRTSSLLGVEESADLLTL